MSTSDWPSYCMCVWLTHMNRTLKQLGFVSFVVVEKKYIKDKKVARKLDIEKTESSVLSLRDRIMSLEGYEESKSLGRVHNPVLGREQIFVLDRE